MSKTIEQKAKAYDKALERAKAKAYDKALERAKAIYQGNYKPDIAATIAKTLQNVFPELKGESEDERIRKAIHIYLDWLDGRNKDYQPKGNYSIKDMIAWLEKQKDCIKLPNSAYTSNRDVIEFADKYSHTIWEKLMDKFKENENYSIGCNDVSDIVLNAIINTYNWLEKQRHNPAELYKEDEQNLNACLSYIQDEFLRRWLTDIIHVKYDNSTWSEEDESMYTRTLGILGKCYMGQLPTKVEEELNWFKSLKNRIKGE